MPGGSDKSPRNTRYDRELRKSGNSTVVTLPPELLTTADLELGDTVRLAASKASITMRKTSSDAELIDE